MNPERELWWALTRVIQRYSIGEAIIQENFDLAELRIVTYRLCALGAVIHA